MNPVNAEAQVTVFIACLCAEWCGVCRDYSNTFSQMQARFPKARFAWIDVEDEDDLLYPLEVENFPTLLVIVNDEPRFFGPLRPQFETLERLIRAQIEDTDAPALTNRAVLELATRIQIYKPAG